MIDNLKAPAEGAPIFGSMSNNNSNIRAFYAGKNIAITGVTGFVGKVLLENLLRTCPEIDTIYVFVRAKKGDDAADRTRALLRSGLFDIVRTSDPNFASKIRTLPGDLTKPQFGLGAEHLAELEQRCNVVFHCAASVAFTDPLPLCVSQNVAPVRQWMAMIGGFKSLDAFCHVSTAYSNCNQSLIEERVYDPPKLVQPEELIAALEWMPAEAVESMTSVVLQDWPNTYTYTKQMAEYFVQKEGTRRGMPCCIVRPSIVTPIADAPLPGWSDSPNGPTGFLGSMGMGILRVIHVDPNAVSDWIPVDVVANVCIAAAMATALAPQEQSSTPVYNCTATRATPLNTNQLRNDIIGSWLEIGPPKNAFRTPSCVLYTSKSIFYYLHIFWSHYMYALCIDAFLKVMGRKPLFRRLYTKVDNMVKTYTYFINGTWAWEDSNVQSLKGLMTPEELKTRRLDLGGFDWSQYLLDYCRGIKTYMFTDAKMTTIVEPAPKPYWTWLVCAAVVGISLVVIPVQAISL